ncbi:hypothetical protein C1J03_14055 [Sulfitobacter sp. SK012]|uniref:head-tail connector protein n=1 Tax=Sulfitobacter sp. SK012 TaxID=1389005 RepID=UPI000E0B33A6|nr:head-tail connector protein [Sulfitobacter sp. SK012]AXI47043.1 hypothetical protein C1J03_14055 [Sulfitobacter sp. SK012]
MLIEETSVPDEALPVEAFKSHLRLGSGFGQDDVQNEVLRSFLRAAMASIEARTNKALIARNFTWTVTKWANPAAQALPVAPVNAIIRMSVVARDGSQTELNPEAYWLDRDGHNPRLRPIAGCLPEPPSNGEVSVVFVAGFGPAWNDLPSDMQQAVLMLAAHYYEYRHDTALSHGCMPFGVTSLIERFRAMRLGRSGSVQ